MDSLIAVRFVHFAATMVAAGTIWLAWTAWPLPTRLDRNLAWLSAGTLAVAALSGAMWLALVAADILGGSPVEVCLNGGVASVLADTRFGMGSGVRLLLAAAMLVLQPWRGLRHVQSLLALAFVALPALTGHAGAMPGSAAYAWVAADMLHLIAAAAWLGGLPAFVLLVKTDLHGVALARAIRRYAAVALGAVAILIGTGLINCLHLLNGPGDLIATSYGRLLSLKLALFAGMLALAADNRLRLTPALPAPPAQGALARNVLGETALGLGVIMLVAALGITPPGGHTHDAGGVPPDAAFVHIHDANAMAEVAVDPGRVGAPSATIRVMREDMSDLAVSAVTLALDPPSNAARPSIEHAAARQPNGTWRIERMDLPVAGTWTVRVTVTPTMGSTFVLDGPIVIAP